MARPLAAALEQRGLSVWLDEYQIKLGDSLRQKIDEGLRQSRFGIVILSPSFFAKRWSRWELDGLVDREVSTGTKVILPVWHELGHDAVAAESPSLANKLAARTSDGIEAVADAVADVLNVPIGDVDRVPRDAHEELVLLRTKPGGWEYLYFAAVLRREMEALETSFRDHEIGFVAPSERSFNDADDAATYIRGAFRRASMLSENLGRILSEDSQTRAFGNPGEPGDPAAIEHLAGRVIDLYAAFLAWATDIRATVVPDEFERTRDLAARFADGPIRQLRDFVRNFVEQMDELPSRLRAIEADPENAEPIHIELPLVLSVDDGVSEDFNRAMDDVR